MFAIATLNRILRLLEYVLRFNKPKQLMWGRNLRYQTYSMHRETRCKTHHPELPMQSLGLHPCYSIDESEARNRSGFQKRLYRCKDRVVLRKILHACTCSSKSLKPALMTPSASGAFRFSFPSSFYAFCTFWHKAATMKDPACMRATAAAVRAPRGAAAAGWVFQGDAT